MTDIAALERRGIDTIRLLAIDAVQRANSGHPGTPMALAPLAHVLYTRVMRYDASAPDWADRDRFILSAGHASMLQYALLYLTGFGLTLDDLRDFRQLGSATPGHPEVHHTAGIEVTTGPLGQGFANSVGMAVAEANLRARFGEGLCDHHIFSICSDGDFMEGISHEAASLAGHLKLGRLVSVYDDNHITIDGPTELAYTDNVPERFRAYGWHVVEAGEVAEDTDAIERALREGMAERDRPSLIVLRSHIGYPSPKFTDTSAAHGAPLGTDEIKVVKGILGFDPDQDFEVSDDVLAFYRAAGTRGRDVRLEWEQRVRVVTDADPATGDDFRDALEGRGRSGWESKLPTFTEGDQVATRVASAKVLDAIIDVVPSLLGGGIDLTGNTGTKLSAAAVFDAQNYAGHQIHFGVREHGAAAAMNGMAMHGGVLPFGGTFLVFSDYCRPAIRLAALMAAKTAFVFSHDSLGVGEDGPTHQPIEQLSALRSIPNLRVLRPADANETAAAWRLHINGDGPTVMILSRQNLPVLAGTAADATAGVAAGAYTLVEPTDDLQVVLVGTGSEVALCVDAATQIPGARVVSMPDREHFLRAGADARAALFPAGVPVLAVEAGIRMGWDALADDVISVDRFGASGPGAQVLEAYGFTPENVRTRARALLGTEDN